MDFLDVTEYDLKIRTRWACYITFQVTVILSAAESRLDVAAQFTSEGALRKSEVGLRFSVGHSP